MTVSTLQPTSLTGNLIGISTLITNTVTADMINTTQLFVSTISLNSFLTNQAVYGPTVKKTSMGALRTITINSTIITNDINAQLDNPPSIPQVYTFGPTIQNRWVVVGYAAPPIAYSEDGIQWTNSNAANDLFVRGLGIAWNGSLWVAVGNGNNSVATSTDGINWLGQGTPALTEGYGVAWGGNKWVAVGNGIVYNIITSTDGINWAGQDATLSIDARSVAWNGYMWVVVGGGTTKIAYSYDAVTWTAVTNSSSIFVSGGTGVAWNGKMWVATGADLSGGSNSNNSVAYSYNGINWVGLGKPIMDQGFCIAWNGRMWVAGGSTYSGGTSQIAYSYDGLYWNNSNLDGSFSQDIIARVQSINWNGTMWTAVGFAASTSSAYSYNGINWVIGTLGFISYGIAFNYRRPYTLTFPTNSTTATISSISPSYTFPITIAQNNQLDICSDSYYNSGYTNFTMTIRGQFS